jgi:hypothetical protein
MSSEAPERDPLEQAAESFLACLRAGERPALSEYEARHPELDECNPGRRGKLPQGVRVGSTGKLRQLPADRRQAQASAVRRTCGRRSHLLYAGTVSRSVSFLRRGMRCRPGSTRHVPEQIAMPPTSRYPLRPRWGERVA